MGRKFTEEMKTEAIKLVLDHGVSKAQAASDLGIGVSTLTRWLSGHKPDQRGEELAESEKEELKRLRKEVHVIRMERDILKKATAFFAKHTV